MRLDELGEFGFIARIADFVGEPQGAVVVGIGDDAAVLKTNGDRYLLVTTDAFVEGQHFRREWLTAAQIGSRATCGAISDIAAMGGQALAVFVSLGLPRSLDAAVGHELMRGIHSVAVSYGASLAGGDTVATLSGICLDVVVVGEVNRPWLRSGARPGDVLVVTGTLGEAAAALHLLQTGQVPDAQALPVALRERFVSPTPQLAVAEALADLPTPPTAIDISDGLVQDAGHLAERSGVALTIEAGTVLISEVCRQAAQALGEDPIRWALTGGEEYELLLALRPDEVQEAIFRVSEQAATQLTRIGFVNEGQGVAVVDNAGCPMELARSGWDHFGQQSV